MDPFEALVWVAYVPRCLMVIMGLGALGTLIGGVYLGLHAAQAASEQGLGELLLVAVITWLGLFVYSGIVLTVRRLVLLSRERR